MRVLLTGSNGQLGKCIGDRLNSYPQNEWLCVSREEMDIANRSDVNHVINEFRPHVIVNTAAYTSVDKAEDEAESAYQINAIGVENIALCAKPLSSTIIHLSTDYVFDGIYESGYKESSPTDPVGVYGKSKLAGEHLLANITDDFLVLRTAWVYSEHGKNFLKTMISLSKNKSELRIVNDQRGNPTDAGDLAKIILQLVNKVDGCSSRGIYHVTGPDTKTWAEFAKDIYSCALQLDKDFSIPKIEKISSDMFKTRARRPANSVMDMSKIRNDFGIAAKPYRESIRRVLKALNDLGEN